MKLAHQLRRRTFALVLLCFVPMAPRTQEKVWTWKDNDGNTRTRAELDEILKKHRQFAESASLLVDRIRDAIPDEGFHLGDLFALCLEESAVPGMETPVINRIDHEIANGEFNLDELFALCDHDETRFMGVEHHVNWNLRAELSRAELSGADLWEADLSGADLSGANLTAATLGEVDLNGADLSGANLTAATLYEVNLTGANLSEARLPKAGLARVYLGDANLSYAQLAGARLTDVELWGADLRGTDLSGAFLDGVDLDSATYEVIAQPNIRGIARVENLQHLTYHRNPDALNELRKQFRDGGFRGQERKITYALKRREAEILLNNCRDRLDRWDCVAYGFNTIAFDATCRYGMNPGRPLKIALILWFLCSIVYVGFIHHSGESGLFRIAAEKNPLRESLIPRKERIRPPRIARTRRLRYLLSITLRELKVLTTAMFFSAMSAFNIGFRDINFGRWLRLLTKREYDIKAVGWARTVAGFQSLISVYMIALWILTYFGRPFE